MERGDDVVVLFAFLVVEQDALLEGFGGDGGRDDLFATAFRKFRGYFEGVKGVAGVAGGVAGDGLEGSIFGG